MLCRDGRWWRLGGEVLIRDKSSSSKAQPGFISLHLSLSLLNTWSWPCKQLKSRDTNFFRKQSERIQWFLRIGITSVLETMDGWIGLSAYLFATDGGEVEASGLRLRTREDRLREGLDLGGKVRDTFEEMFLIPKTVLMRMEKDIKTDSKSREL